MMLPIKMMLEPYHDFYQIHVVYITELPDGYVENDLEFVIPDHYNNDEIFDIAFNYVSCISVFPFAICMVNNYATGTTMDYERNLSTTPVL